MGNGVTSVGISVGEYVGLGVVGLGVVGLGVVGLAVVGGGVGHPTLPHLGAGLGA